MVTPDFPVNIMADPRVFRGSVAARQREEVLRLRQEMATREAEERYRAGVVRNRLNLALGTAKIMGGAGDASPSAIPIGRRFARLNGPVGRHAYEATTGVFSPTALELLHNIDAKMPPIVLTVGEIAEKKRQGTAGSQRSHYSDGGKSAISKVVASAHLSRHSASAESLLLPELPSKSNLEAPTPFRSVRFQPFRPGGGPLRASPAPSAQLHGTGVMSTKSNVPQLPRFPTKRGVAGGGAISSRRFGQFGVHKHKSMLARADQGIPTSLGSNTQMFPRHTKQWSELPDAANPPPTATGPVYFMHESCQTDEMLVFNEAFEPLIREMVSGAIADAQRSLLEEDQLKQMEQQNRELLRIVVAEKQRNTELSQNIEQQTVQKQTLEKEKQSAAYLLDAIECKKVADDTVHDLTDKCLNRLMDRAMIRDDKFTKDVAADTRQLEKDGDQFQRAIEEIERDFFPYVYQQAERVFVHRLADSFLKDALFANNQSFRAEAHERLNEKIAEYNRLLRKTRPGQQTAPLRRMLSGVIDSPEVEVMKEILGPI
ncbi:hypothetical protein M3Y96_00120100 [Aphelenchoides besseyi]|nr:hypothetical protein M3Y96_00120100 [Aphelenchoides besseyi]